MPIDNFNIQPSPLKLAAARVIKSHDDDPLGAQNFVRIHPSAQLTPALVPSRVSGRPDATDGYGYGLDHGRGFGQGEVELALRGSVLATRVDSPAISTGPARSVMTDEGGAGDACCWDGCIDCAQCLADCLCCLPKCLCECLCSDSSSGGGSCCC